MSDFKFTIFEYLDDDLDTYKVVYEKDYTFDELKKVIRTRFSGNEGKVQLDNATKGWTKEVVPNGYDLTHSYFGMLVCGKLYDDWYRAHTSEVNSSDFGFGNKLVCEDNSFLPSGIEKLRKDLGKMLLPPVGYGHRKIKESLNDELALLNDKALRAYDREDDEFFHDCSDDELMKLWSLCLMWSGNTWGRAYDDEVYDEIVSRDEFDWYAPSDETFAKAKEYFAAHKNEPIFTILDESMAQGKNHWLKESFHKNFPNVNLDDAMKKYSRFLGKNVDSTTLNESLARKDFYKYVRKYLEK